MKISLHFFPFNSGDTAGKAFILGIGGVNSSVAARFWISLLFYQLEVRILKSK